MNPSLAEILGTTLFAVAVIHTFLSSWFQGMAHRYPEGSIQENLFHLLGEVEVVFGLWAGILIAAMCALVGVTEAVHYAEGLNFTEPLFVFAIMAVAATRPVIRAASRLILGASRLLPIQRERAAYLACLVLGPLLGSFITEPAAMTVTALILRDRYFVQNLSTRFRYVTLATLFVNVSIGGVLTHFAAPPVLMVAGKWQWGIGFMLQTFGWKAACAVIVNALLATFLIRSDLDGIQARKEGASEAVSPAWLTLIHLAFMSLIVLTSHHPVLFVGLFMFFLGITTVTREYQSELKIRQSLLVAFFLGGLVVLGGLQGWWLEPLIRGLDTFPLFVGTSALTAFTDNAALTYLGSLVENPTEAFKYALVSGAVAGGGLTVIANAPNPAGYSILQDCFGENGISPLKLAAAAAIPTLISMTAFWLL